MMKITKKYLKKNKNIYKKLFYSSTPLHTIYPGVPQATENINYRWNEPKIQNVDGIRVVSIDSTAPQSSVTLSFHSGSRVENSDNAGVTSFLKNFAFKATKNHTQVGITRGIELNTVSFNSSASREDISYNANLARYQIESFFPFLGEITQPKIREFEVRWLESSVLKQSANLAKDPLNLLVDRFHRVAYRGEGLGNVISPHSSRASLEHSEWVDVLQQYVKDYYVRERAVVVGVGVDGETLANLVKSSLSNLPRGSDEIPKSTKYNGGEHLGDTSGSSHFLIGFEGLPLVSPKLHALNLVYTLLGSGTKLQRQVPGDGVTSLLNRNVVEKLSNVHAASAYTASYRDTGLFGIYINAEGQLANAVDAVYEQLNGLSKISAEQLEGAKRQLKLSLSSYYENGVERRAELAKRQVLSGLEPVSDNKFVSGVDGVSLEEFRGVVKAVFSSRPVLVAEGNLSGLPGTEQLSKKIN